MRVGDYIQASQSKDDGVGSSPRAVAPSPYSDNMTVRSSIAYSIDPEEEAFKALKKSICSICKKQDITSSDDKRLIKIVGKYKNRYPELTPELIMEEVEAVDACIPSIVNRGMMATTDEESLPMAADNDVPSSPAGSTNWTRPSTVSRKLDEADSSSSLADDKDKVVANTLTVRHALPSSAKEEVKNIEEDEQSIQPPPPPDTAEKEEQSKEKEAGVEKELGCWTTFKSKCKENNGYNLYTYTIFLTILMILMLIVSVIYTYFNYNIHSYRDWALVGGVTSTTAEFRVRGPSSDDGKAREFVVSTNANLAIEKDQILNIPVSYGDFEPEEHYMKRLSLDDLDPLTPYFYGITRPKRTPNSAVVAGDVGTFVTPAPIGTRMDFTIATGSCAFTGSNADMFKNVLDVNPLLFIHMGDMHYEDSSTLDVDERLEAYDKVMGSPSQRLLYMRTIFSYIWDDHDWLGNNEDSDNNEEAASVAKQGYTLGIPHYDLGSSSTDEANAAKYQAFTIGTVRFIISDLRSESIKSSEYYSGKIYSREQKEWLFNELSQAENYDFVVWVTPRPWTGPAEIGSDSWAGFASERDELSAHIASVIGDGPQNLLVISGDNHMVAYDDGSSTDFSGQEDSPAGFPLLHSGPMTNYGGLKEMILPNTEYFTDGCMAYSNEINHQFSTIDFSFPTNVNQLGCMRLRSYSEDASNVIFEQELCGEIMKYGTPEQDTCTMKKLSWPTASLFIFAAGLILISFIWMLWFLGVQLAFSYSGLAILFYLLTIGAAFAGAYSFHIKGVDMFVVSIFVAIQTTLGCLFVWMSILEHRSINNSKTKKHDQTIDEDDSIIIEDDHEVAGDVGEVKKDDKDEAQVEKMNAEAKAQGEKGDKAITQDDAFNDSPPVFPMVHLISKSDVKQISDHTSEIMKDLESTSGSKVSPPSATKGVRKRDKNASSDSIDLDGNTPTPLSNSGGEEVVDKTDDASERALLFGEERSLERNSSFGLASIISFPDVKDMTESMSAAYTRSKQALAAATTSTFVASTPPRKIVEEEYLEDEEERTVEGEGIEVTSPSYRTLKTSPTLISL